MSVDPLADKIHELRGDRRSLQWTIDEYRAKGEIPPDDLLSDLRRVGSDLLVALDDRAEKI